jgi:sugar/nucleoside kinase (ribokinase family)
VICTLGDLLLDVIVRLDEPIAEDADTYGRTRVGPGGQAANVAAWIVELGGSARFIGKRARDRAGRILAEELQSQGVQLAGPVEESGTGTVVSITGSDGRRTMLTDRGVSTEFRPDELDAHWLDDCELLHVPAYSLVRSPLAETALAAIGVAVRAGADVSVDLSSTTVIRAYGGERFTELMARVSPDFVLGNEEEVALLGKLELPVVVIKRGRNGCRVIRHDVTTEYPARPAHVVDSTGAGDAFAAGYLLEGHELALEAAARCVSHVGAAP